EASNLISSMSVCPPRPRQVVATRGEDSAPSVTALGPVRIEGKFFTRAGKPLRLQGVSYGPFGPNRDGEPFPAAQQVSDDFARMQACGINSVRTYHAPPEWFLNAADENGMLVLVDVPWPRHLCILESTSAQQEAWRLVQQTATHGRSHPSVLGY